MSYKNSVKMFTANQELAQCCLVQALCLQHTAVLQQCSTPASMFLQRTVWTHSLHLKIKMTENLKDDVSDIMSKDLTFNYEI